jgi:hypothetical protein
MFPDLTTIARLLPPPRSPRGLDRSWNAVESELGLELPQDYKAFIDLSGSGQISSAEGWVLVWNFRDGSLGERQELFSPLPLGERGWG